VPNRLVLVPAVTIANTAPVNSLSSTNPNFPTDRSSASLAAGIRGEPGGDRQPVQEKIVATAFLAVTTWYAVDGAGRSLGNRI
jgi:hypothetical protein